MPLFKFSGAMTDKVTVMLGNWDSSVLLGIILWAAQLKGSMAKSFIFSQVMCLCLGTAQSPVVLVLWILYPFPKGKMTGAQKLTAHLLSGTRIKNV